MRSRHIGGVLALSLWMTGCLAETHVAQDPLPLEDFCATFFDALCEPLAECDCGSAELACLSDGAGLCASFPSPELHAAVASGLVRYDGSRAAAVVRTMRGRASECRGFVEVLDWKVRDLLTLGGVFEGTLPAGAPCDSLGFELVSACAGGTCWPSGGGSVCHEAVGVGAPCDRHHVCADLAGGLTVERGIDRLTLRCVPLESDGEAGTCAPWREEGETCESDEQCWSGRCTESGCQPLGEGEACFSGRECGTEHCGPSSSTCEPSERSIGEPCMADEACESRVCVDGSCRSVGCGTF